MAALQISLCLFEWGGRLTERWHLCVLLMRVSLRVIDSVTYFVGVSVFLEKAESGVWRPAGWVCIVCVCVCTCTCIRGKNLSECVCVCAVCVYRCDFSFSMQTGRSVRPNQVRPDEEPWTLHRYTYCSIQLHRACRCPLGMAWLILPISGVRYLTIYVSKHRGALFKYHIAKNVKIMTGENRNGYISKNR